MLIRRLCTAVAICALVAFASCQRSLDAALIGTWRSSEQYTDDVLQADLTFEVGGRFSMTKISLLGRAPEHDVGTWRLNGHILTLHFPNDHSSAENPPIPDDIGTITSLTKSTLIVKGTSGQVTTQQRIR